MFHAPRTFALVALLALAPTGARLALAEDPAPAAPSIDDTRGYVGYGVHFVRGLTAEQRKELKIVKEDGLFVQNLLMDGPAEKAGLLVGDVLLKMNGKDMPDTKDLDMSKNDTLEKFLGGPFKTLTSTIKPGESVELVVDRNGTTVTLKAVAIDKATMEKLREEQRDEAASVAVPKPEGRGEPAEAGYDFEKLADDAVRPDDFLNVSGFWEAKDEEGASPKNTVLRQSSDTGDGFALAYVTADQRVYTNGKVSVRLMLVSGETSVSGGIVVRARDRKNWYGIRLDGVSQDLRIVAMKKNVPSVLAKTSVKSPKLKTWHTLEVTFQGDTITAVLDGTVKVEATDSALTSGWCGLLTSGDAETNFDDLKIIPAK